MKVKIGKWRVNIKSFLSTLIRIEWKWPLPKIFLHEKFERKIKWTLRILTFIGIATSVISLEPIYSLGLSIGLLLIEQFFERILFHYTIFIVQPPPEFKVDLKAWKTNGYLFPHPKADPKLNLKNAFGPTYTTRKYAIEFFSYMASWVGDNDDTENTLCVSFVLEEDGSYTTYFYANQNRKGLDKMSDEYKESMKVEKYGKNAQTLVMQMIYWKNLEIVKGSIFPIFLKSQAVDKDFHFLPFYLNGEVPTPIEELQILKHSYKLKNRRDLTPADIEYHFK